MDDINNIISEKAITNFQIRHNGDIIRILNPINKIPVTTQELHCYKYNKNVLQEELNELFAKLPSFRISKRFYTGDDLDIKDTFKMFADKKNLYIKLKFINTKGYGESVCKRHILLFKNKGYEHSITTVDIDYESKKDVSVGYKNINQSIGYGNTFSQRLQDTHIDIVKNDTGYEAFVFVPLETIGSHIENLQFNIIRVDWGAHPMTSFIPIGNSYFNEYENNKVNIVIFLYKQGRFSDITVIEDMNHPIHSNSKIEMFFEKDNYYKIIYSEQAECEFTWIEPDNCRHIIKKERIKHENTFSILFNPPLIVKEGLYRIQLHNKNKTTIYFEKQDLIEAVAPVPDFNPKTKICVDIDKISGTAKKMLDIVPEFSGLENVPDPKDTSLRPWMLYRYDLKTPQKIISVKTGDTYPDDQYPQTHMKRIDNGSGRIIEYPYYENSEGVVFYFSPALWANQKKYICENIVQLAQADPAGAAVVLEKLCRYYPHYAPAMDYYFINFPVSKAVGPPYPYFGGLWTRWFYADLKLVAEIAEAYSVIMKTDAFDRLENKLKRNLVYEVQYLIKDSVDYIKSYGIQDGNMDTPVWKSLIRIGKALDRYDFIHDALGRIDTFLANNFMFDGFWKETTLSYHNNVVQGIVDTLSMLDGYSDPQGYIYPGEGKPLCDLKPFKRYPILQKSLSVSKAAQYPNRKFIPVQDTHLSVCHDECDLIYENMLLSAAKIVKLAGPGKELQTQVVLLMEAKYGHSHNDSLNFNLFSNGIELLPDLGYTHTNNRAFTISTLSHNTVTVNEKDSNNPKGGNLLQFIPSKKGTPGLVRGEDHDSYDDVSIYDRQILTVPDGSSGAIGYVLDIFRVEGGNKHEYALNLCADYDTTLSCSVKMRQQSETMLPAGIKFKKPVRESHKGDASGHYYAYMFVTDVKYARLNNESYKVSYVINNDEHKGKGLHIHGTKTQGVISLGRSPAMRETRVSFAYDLNDRKDMYMLDKLIIKREQPGDLNSVFVHLAEPFLNNNTSCVQQIEKFFPTSDEKDVCIKVCYKNFIDYIFSAYDNMVATFDGIYFAGSYGFIRLKDDKVELIQTQNAIIKYNELTFGANNSVTGEIEKCFSLSRGDAYNGFSVRENINRKLIGKTVIITHPDDTTHGYIINDIINYNNKTIIDTGDTEPGFIIDDNGDSSMYCFPFFNWKGVTRYKVDDVYIDYS